MCANGSLKRIINCWYSIIIIDHMSCKFFSYVWTSNSFFLISFINLFSLTSQNKMYCHFFCLYSQVKNCCGKHYLCLDPEKLYLTCQNNFIEGFSISHFLEPLLLSALSSFSSFFSSEITSFCIVALDIFIIGVAKNVPRHKSSSNCSTLPMFLPSQKTNCRTTLAASFARLLILLSSRLPSA